MEVLQSLRRVMPIDAAFFATVDPTTLLFTSALADDILNEAIPQFLANEFMGEDANAFVALARSRQHVQTLLEATSGVLKDSARYRDILSPMGFGDELRAALVVDHACWGVICLHRERSHFSYTPSEAAFLARLAPHIAEGLRASLAAGELAASVIPEGPGVLLLADDLALVAATPAAEYWIAEIGARNDSMASELPRAVTAVAARLLALEKQDDRMPYSMPRVRLRTESGMWIVLHASRLGDTMKQGYVAVTIEKALPSDIAPVALMSYGLSIRQAEVAQLVLGGRSTAEIACDLYISSDTVQDHLKAVFDKTGVRSRRELVAAIFDQQYLPHMKAGIAPSSRGGFHIT
ncbi:MAG: LuxR C-terminal-related transcriptional regulator [Chloroflexota bacterium]